MPIPASHPTTAEELRRLALVRHLYDLGVAQSRGPEPTASLSVLPFHDAAESFLLLACERYDVGENKADFMRYWSFLEEKGIKVPQREAMRRLSAARRGLKHQGIPPAHTELEGLRAAVTNFSYDATPLIFGIDFASITLVNLVNDADAKEELQLGYTALAAHDHKAALDSAAKAFILVQRAHSQLSDTPSLRRSLSQQLSGSAIRDLERELGSQAARPVGAIVNGFAQAIASLGEVVEMIGFGMELREYWLFKSHMPVVHQIIDGPLHVEWMGAPTSDPEIVGRCLNFVVEAAVRLRV